MKFKIDLPVYFFTMVDKIPGVIHAANQDEYGNWIYEIRVGSTMLFKNVREHKIKERILGGLPKYKHGDKVKFQLGEEMSVGIIEIVDAYGTFEQDEEASYDIFVEGTPGCLYKHVRESEIVGIAE